jgi:hypothetical protein
MKKVVFVVLLSTLSSIGYSQIKNDKGTFEKPVAGTILIESSLSPNIVGGTLFSLNDMFLQNLSDGLNEDAVTGDGGPSRPKVTLPMLKGRYFIADNMAIRGLFNLAWGSNSEDNDGKVAKVSETGFAISAGVEKHFTGAERLSTYVGADLLIGMSQISSSFEDDGKTEFSNSGFGIGLRGITGFDYYFIPKVYLGMEVGYGLSYNSYGVVKASGDGLSDGKATSSSFGLSPFISPALRLGFRF